MYFSKGLRAEEPFAMLSGIHRDHRGSRHRYRGGLSLPGVTNPREGDGRDLHSPVSANAALPARAGTLLCVLGMAVQGGASHCWGVRAVPEPAPLTLRRSSCHV